jgi:hypothetical protein
MPNVTNSPSAASGTNWTNPTNVYSSNDSRASYANTAQNALAVTGFSFSIPSNATIVGIEVLIEGQGSSSTAANRNIQPGLTKNGSALVGTRATAQNLALNSDTTLTFGSASSLWGTTWTYSEINASTFGALVRVGNTNNSTRQVDHVQIRVTYSQAFTQSASDSLAIGEAEAHVLQLNKSVSDALTVSESRSGATTFNRSSTDPVTLGESTGRVATLARSSSDALSLGESSGKVSTFNRASSDAMGLGESTGRAATFNRSSSDGLALGESRAGASSFNRSEYDPLGLGETDVAALRAARSFADAFSLGDAQTSNLTGGGTEHTKAAADALALTDTASALLVAVVIVDPTQPTRTRQTNMKRLKTGGTLYHKYAGGEFDPRLRKRC